MFIGGRGIGKTYSVLKGVLESGKKFMYVRRTETELKNCCTPVNNPFLTLNDDLDRQVEVSKQGDFYVIHEGDRELGVAGSVSTFGKFRGSDFSKIEYIVFDEFINTTPRNTIKNEDFLFFNLVETVQRNRELTGRSAIKIILLSNSNTLNNAIIRSLKLGEIIRNMKDNEIERYEDIERDLLVVLPKAKKLTEAKKKTKLYKLTAGSDFYNMAINNDFVNEDFTNVKKLPNNILVPLCQFEKACFYTIKNEDKLYVSYRKNESPYFDMTSIKNFKRQYGLLLAYYFENHLTFFCDYDLALFVKSIFSC